jgi:hypothetical protein
MACDEYKKPCVCVPFTYLNISFITCQCVGHDLRNVKKLPQLQMLNQDEYIPKQWPEVKKLSFVGTKHCAWYPCSQWMEVIGLWKYVSLFWKE